MVIFAQFLPGFSTPATTTTTTPHPLSSFLLWHISGVHENSLSSEGIKPTTTRAPQANLDFRQPHARGSLQTHLATAANLCFAVSGSFVG